MASPLAPNRPVVKLKRAKGKAAPKRPKPSPKNTVSANPAEARASQCAGPVATRGVHRHGAEEEGMSPPAFWPTFRR